VATKATGERLVRPQAVAERIDAHGRLTRTRGHRAGWDATFSAPKGVSLTALVGGDDGVRTAHAASVAVALDALQEHVQARLGGALAPDTTRNWAAARFEHDSARPVHGYAAPQLHTHVVVFNLTETADGRIRPLQPRELFRSQAFATAVYRSELAHRLVGLGYEIERGGSGQPEIRGYSAAYLEASSPRRQQIAAHLLAHGRGGAAAAEIAAHHTRDAKVPFSAAAVLRQHRTLAEAFGDQPRQVRQAAYARGRRPPEVPGRAAAEAVAYSVARNFERHAVVSDRAILCDALDRSQRTATLMAVREAVAGAERRGELITVQVTSHRTDHVLTTQTMLALEGEAVARMQAGQRRSAPIDVSRTEADRHPHLNVGQAHALREIVESRDQILGLDGVAGAGKTTLLAAFRPTRNGRGLPSGASPRPRVRPSSCRTPASPLRRCKRI
jgi:conjugative relaxase-like TrwC/TraI family protein